MCTCSEYYLLNTNFINIIRLSQNQPGKEQTTPKANLREGINRADIKENIDAF